MRYNAQSVASGCLPLSGGTMTGDIINGAITDANNTVSISADYPVAGIRIDSSQYQVNATQISLYPHSGGCRIGSGIGNLGSSDKYMRICNVADPIGPADVANKDYVDSKAGGISLNKSGIFSDVSANISVNTANTEMDTNLNVPENTKLIFISTMLSMIDTSNAVTRLSQSGFWDITNTIIPNFNFSLAYMINVEFRINSDNHIYVKCPRVGELRIKCTYFK